MKNILYILCVGILLFNGLVVIASKTTTLEYEKEQRLIITDDFDPLVDINVTVDILVIRSLDTIDIVSGPDFFVKVFINDEEFISPIWRDLSYLYDCYSITKNVPDDIELINVTRDLKNYKFWFAGIGPLKKLIILPNTKYLGYFNDNELIKIYNRATICAFPSRWENYPVVGLEAFACGKATIATRIGFSEIFDHNKNGLLINPKISEELKSAIMKLMKNPGFGKSDLEISSGDLSQFGESEI